MPEAGAAPCVYIGERAIGSGCAPYVIAEAGVNHDGDTDLAVALVDAAADAGADAVKFQVFTARELASATAPAAAYQQDRGTCTQRQLLERLELPDAALSEVARQCRCRGVEFLATPFGLADVERLLALEVRAFKLASTDLNNVPLLRRIAATERPLLVSTGAATAPEIDTAVARLREWGAAQRLVLLHCVSRYPAPLDAANLRAVRTLHERFGVPAGLSDHTRDLRTGAWAAALGACVLEKHFTLDHSLPGPDHAMSLEPAELRAYIGEIRAMTAALGTGVLGMTDLEAEVRAVARKSVVAATFLAAGTRLRPELLTLKRPGGGIPPDELESLAGRTVNRDVPADALLTWDMFT